MFQWDPLGGASAALFLVVLAIAAIVLLAAPGRLANRWLSVSLVAEAFAGQSGGAARLLTDPGQAYALGIVMNLMGGAAAFFLFLGFLGAALQTPLVRPFRPYAARWALAVGAVLSVVALLIIDDPVRWSGPIIAADAAMLVFSLVAAIDAFRRTPTGSLVRTRARAYLLAFGTRDVSATVVLLYQVVLGSELPLSLEIFFLVAAAIYVALLVYGILKTHLFDVRMRIRWTLHKGTIAAVFALAFIVAAQLAENILNQRLGWLWGGLSAGLLLFAMNPILRFADRVARAAVPDGRPLAGLTSSERHRFYEDHVRAAWEDGSIDRSDRALLNTLREKLGLSVADAGAIEVRITS